jgi:hypothetical protein
MNLQLQRGLEVLELLAKEILVVLDFSTTTTTVRTMVAVAVLVAQVMADLETTLAV